MFKKFSTLSVVVTAFKSTKKPVQTLEQELDSAQRAEQPINKHLRESHGYSSLIEATHGEEAEDGMFVCCCGAENDIVHFMGTYPFKYMNCRIYDHTFCNKCTSSEVLTPIQAAMLPPCLATPSMANNLGQICAACGLTHRATLSSDGMVDKNVRCHCGSQSDNTWIMFGTLSPDKYL
jgi:hypothetical protein